MLLRFAFLASLGALGAAANYLREEENHDEHHNHDDHHHPMPKEACIGEEKGIRCHAGFKNGQGFKECEAGMRKNFTAAFDDAMTTAVANGLHSQMHEILPNLHDGFFFAPSSTDVIEDVGLWDDATLLETLEEGVSKEMSFGGEATIDFGCKVAFEKKDGKIHKKVECGMKAKATAGKKEHMKTLKIIDPPNVVN